MCMAVCPLYKATGWETDSARGKIALLSAITQEILSDGQSVSARTGRCLLCGACALKCPRGIRAHELLIQARACFAAYHGLSLIEKILFRSLLSNPDRFDAVSDFGAKGLRFFSNFAGQAGVQNCPAIFFGGFLKPLTFKPFHDRIKEAPGPSSPSFLRKKTVKVGFFIGCLIDKFYPEVGMAALNILCHSDVDVETPMHQGCCGMPALAAGDRISFIRLVQRHLALFPVEKYDAILSACPTCVVAIKHLWPLMMANASPTLKERIRLLSEKTLDIHQFLYGLYKERPMKEPAPDALSMTYHAPCHLKKSLGIDQEPIFLMQMNPRVRLIGHKDADACCGFGGSFHLKHHDISLQIGERKRQSILKSGVRKVVTGCPACLLQLEEVFYRNQDDISVVHTMEIVSEIFVKG